MTPTDERLTDEKLREALKAYMVPSRSMHAWLNPGDLTEAYAAMRAVLAPLLDQARAEGRREAGAWQPIETAPKDGTVILAWIPAHEGDKPEVAPVRWQSHVTGRWVHDASDWTLEAPMPTHWQPLPAPPVARTPEEG